MFWRGIPAIQDAKAPPISIANMEIFFISIQTLRHSLTRRSTLTTKDISFTTMCPLRLQRRSSSCPIQRSLDLSSGSV
jgi:hypothetical protein